MPQCEAKRRRSDEPCRAKALRGRPYCRMHGGKVPVGPDNPAYKHGQRANPRYALLTPELRSAMDAARNDPERLELLADIDLVKAKLDSLMADAARAALALGRADKAGNPVSTPPWLELREAWEAVLKAAPGSTERRLAEARFGAVINAGATNDQCWQEWAGLAELARRLVETQTRRDEKRGQFIPAEKVSLLVRTLVGSVHRHVKDPAAVRAIQADILALQGTAAPAAPHVNGTVTAVARA